MSHAVWIILPDPGIGNNKFLVFEDSYRSRDIFEESVKKTYSRNTREITFEHGDNIMRAKIYDPPDPKIEDSTGITDIIVARKYQVATMPASLE
jgi:hypothetical protein